MMRSTETQVGKLRLGDIKENTPEVRAVRNNTSTEWYEDIRGAL